MTDERKSKKELILDAAQALKIAKLGRRQMHRIQAYLVRQSGVAAKPSPSYIVQILCEAGIPIEAETQFTGSGMEEPYATRLNGLLQFQNLQVAEESLRNLHAAFEEYRQAGDRLGMRRVCGLVLKGKQRAEAIVHNPRINPANRKVKQEIVNWFRVWLESPDLFFVWLEVRKKSEEFGSLEMQG